jgi:hypothetical protein
VAVALGARVGGGVAVAVGTEVLVDVGVHVGVNGAGVGEGVGVEVSETVAVAVGRAELGGGGVARPAAAWPKLARNTEKAISMARICLTAYLPPEASSPPSKHPSAHCS